MPSKVCDWLNEELIYLHKSPPRLQVVPNLISACPTSAPGCVEAVEASADKKKQSSAYSKRALLLPGRSAANNGRLDGLLFASAARRPQPRRSPLRCRSASGCVIAARGRRARKLQAATTAALGATW